MFWASHEIAKRHGDDGLCRAPSTFGCPLAKGVCFAVNVFVGKLLSGGAIGAVFFRSDVGFTGRRRARMTFAAGMSGGLHYHPSDLERLSVRYVGLLNQGATCCMNSLVQQLFIVDEFREHTLTARLDEEQEEADKAVANGAKEVVAPREHPDLPEESSVLYRVQLLFGYLLKSQKYYDTMPLCRVLRGFTGCRWASSRT